jgi:hypothetical protein
MRPDLLIRQRNFAGHALNCQCERCSENDRLQQQHVTRDAPMSTLPDSTVSLREVLDYKVLEDWSDD